jgi:hypothetical protein
MNLAFWKRQRYQLTILNRECSLVDSVLLRTAAWELSVLHFFAIVENTNREREYGASANAFNAS